MFCIMTFEELDTLGVDIMVGTPKNYKGALLLISELREWVMVMKGRNDELSDKVSELNNQIWEMEMGEDL